MKIAHLRNESNTPTQFHSMMKQIRRYQISTQNRILVTIGKIILRVLHDKALGGKELGDEGQGGGEQGGQGGRGGERDELGRGGEQGHDEERGRGEEQGGQEEHDGEGGRGEQEGRGDGEGQHGELDDGGQHGLQGPRPQRSKDTAP